MDGPIEFSGRALEAFKEQIERASQPPRAVRLGVRGGACSGLEYVIMFDYDEPRKGDRVWEAGGVSFRVDAKSVAYLSGSSVDWRSTLMKEGFEFANPNEASRCGCGHSFSVR